MPIDLVGDKVKYTGILPSGAPYGLLECDEDGMRAKELLEEAERNYGVQIEVHQDDFVSEGILAIYALVVYIVVRELLSGFLSEVGKDFWELVKRGCVRLFGSRKLDYQPQIQLGVCIKGCEDSLEVKIVKRWPDNWQENDIEEFFENISDLVKRSITIAKEFSVKNPGEKELNLEVKEHLEIVRGEDPMYIFSYKGYTDERRGVPECPKCGIKRWVDLTLEPEDVKSKRPITEKELYWYCRQCKWRARLRAQRNT